MYVKLFGTILDSSIWAEDTPTRVVFITMLAMAGPDGIVRASPTGLARRANVTAQECRKALEILEGPDLESRSQEWGGRRIERVDSGWKLLNYERYREIRDADTLRAQGRERVRRHRERKRSVTLSNVLKPQEEEEGEVEVEGEGEEGQRAAPAVTEGRLTQEGQEALEGLCRASANPTALLAEVRMILDGGRPGVPADPAAVSLALHDLRLNGGRVGGAQLRAFVQRAARPVTPAAGEGDVKRGLERWAGHG